jgi:hypothetical protein
MSRAGWLFLVIAVVAGAAVPRPPAPALHAALDFAPVDDPFPIRRVRGTDARLPELMKELEPGPVVRMPRPEFEARVRAAGRSVLGARLVPRVVDVTLAAELDGADLVGTAEFGVLNAHGTTGFVALDPLRLAVRGAKWSDGTAAVLAVPGGATVPAVWTDRAGRRVLKTDWSLTGTSEPGERRFELRVPACPTAALELDLPADQVPTVSADVLLTGPFEVPGKPARRSWRFRFGGRSKLEFAVRAAGPAAGVARAKLSARYDIAAGQLTAAFEYELHPARGSAGEWTFTADPGLRITDVVANNRAGWTVDPPTAPGGPRRVRVSLRQPGPGGKVLVTAVAPFPDSVRSGYENDHSLNDRSHNNRADAPLPAVRPQNAVLDDEKLELRIAPGLKVESWMPGDYRLVEATNTTGGVGGLATGALDPARVLVLVGTLLPPNVDEAHRRMPTVRTAPAEAEFTSYERLAWDLDVARAVVVARLSVRVRRGPLFQLIVRPPPGFVLDRGATGSDELVAHIGAPGAAGQVVEFARPLATGQQAEVRLEFRGPGARPGEPVPFPAPAVLGAAERDGWLSVSAPPAWAVVTRAGAGACPGGLWGWLTTDAPSSARAVYLFRGREPDGTATLTAARPAVTADALVQLDAAEGRWTATTRFTVTATDGVFPTAAVFVPGEPDATGRSWKLLDETNTITDAVPVPHDLLALAPLLAPGAPRAGLVAARAGGGVLRFARPVASAVFETTAVGPPTSAPAALPVPRWLGASQTVRAEMSPGLKDRWVPELSGAFISPRPVPTPAGELELRSVSDAYLVTAVRAPDEALAAFGGTVREGRGGTLRVTLPLGAEVRGVCVAGRWLNPAACPKRDGERALTVPIPAGPAVRFEIRYRLVVAPGWPTRRVESPVPDVGGGTPQVRRWWAYAAGTLPGWPARPWEATTDAPPLLGGALGSGERAAVLTLSDDETVRVGAARTADALAAGLVAGWVVFGLIAVQIRRGHGAVVLAAATVAGLLVVELGPPWWARATWPPLCASTGALGVVLVTLALRARRAVPAGAAGAAAIVLVLVYSLGATAQPAAPATVLIVPNSGGGEEVIAARTVIDRLDALARPQPPATVVSAADYAVRVEDGTARVIAKFVVRAFRPGDNTLTLPLSDVRLERATVDGAQAFPTAPRPDTYALAVGGPGRHEVELRFAVTVLTTGPEREVRFGVPEVPEARVSASIPGAARLPQIVGRVGRQIAGTSGDRATITADLGAAKSVHLRWREGAAGATVVKVREACVWDVREARATLTAAYLARVEQGTAVGLRFEIPAELEVLRVAARTTDAPAGPIPLRDWTLAAEKGGGRLLRVDFQAPVAGRLLLVLECAPRRPLTRQPVLRFPRVNFGTVTGEVESVYGLRATQITIDGVGLGGVIDFPIDALKDFTVVPDLGLDPANPVRAFRPAPGVVAELRPVLHIGEPPTVRTATAWHVGPHRADATGTVSWQTKEVLPLVEFTLGGVKVLDVRGSDVAAWSQSGGRVQVWLRTGTRDGALEWTGTTVPVPAGKAPAPFAFDPVHPVVAHAKAASDAVRVKPIDDWAVRADRSRGWQIVSGRALKFHTDLPSAPPLRVQLSPLPGTGR